MIADKILETSKEPLRTDEMDVWSASERPDKSKGMFKFEQMSE